MGVDLDVIMDCSLTHLSPNELVEYFNENLRLNFPTLTDVDASKIKQYEWIFLEHEWGINLEFHSDVDFLFRSTVYREGAFYLSSICRWSLFLTDETWRIPECETARMFGRFLNSKQIVYCPDCNAACELFEDAANFEGFMKLLREKYGLPEGEIEGDKLIPNPLKASKPDRWGYWIEYLK